MLMSEPVQGSDVGQYLHVESRVRDPARGLLCRVEDVAPVRTGSLLEIADHAHGQVHGQPVEAGAVGGGDGRHEGVVLGIEPVPSVAARREALALGGTFPPSDTQVGFL